MRFLSISLLVCALVSMVATGHGGAAASSSESMPVRMEIWESLPADEQLDPRSGSPVESYRENALALVAVPNRYGPAALVVDRSTPFTVRLSLKTALEGRQVIRLRARNASRLLIDGKEVAVTPKQKPNGSAHDLVEPMPEQKDRRVRVLAPAHREVTVELDLDGREHEFVLVALIGGKGLAPVPGEVSVSAGRPGDVPQVIGSAEAPLLADIPWRRWAAGARERAAQRAESQRLAREIPIRDAWRVHHARIRQWLAGRSAPPAPPSPAGFRSSGPIDQFLNHQLAGAGLKQTPPLSDLQFLRRVSLDTTGLIPTPDAVVKFLADPPAERRKRALDRLLADPSWADHWVSYWQDVLAENPGILKPDLNNSGPFRWWLRRALADNRPVDRMVVELVKMEGSAPLGGPAGFGLAALNDAPMAAKADILGRAFLSVNLSCARCHDAPAHPFKQRQLFSLSALLARKSVTVPVTSTVVQVAGFRPPNVVVTVKPGEPIAPEWPFHDLVPGTAFRPPNTGSSLKPDDPRSELAALLVAPENQRFAEVLVNRVWARLLGRGLVDSTDDWTGAETEHPDLLRYLARDFVAGGYDLKRLARSILLSDAYARQATSADRHDTEARLFAGPQRRRMSAEQVVDSLFQAAGKRMRSEPMNLSPLGNKGYNEFIDLGTPTRSWHFTALSNERDRPSLALPIAQSIVDVLSAYGWRPSRQNPTTARDDAPTALQKLILANGIMGTRIARLSDDSAFTEMALASPNAGALVESLFMRILTRKPTPRERAAFERLLAPAFGSRVVPGAVAVSTEDEEFDPRVSWANHLSEEANAIRLQEERTLRLGDPPTRRLTAAFREPLEDVVWALINSPEAALAP